MPVYLVLEVGLPPLVMQEIRNGNCQKKVNNVVFGEWMDGEGKTADHCSAAIFVEFLRALPSEYAVKKFKDGYILCNEGRRMAKGHPNEMALFCTICDPAHRNPCFHCYFDSNAARFVVKISHVCSHQRWSLMGKGQNCHRYKYALDLSMQCEIEPVSLRKLTKWARRHRDADLTLDSGISTLLSVHSMTYYEKRKHDHSLSLDEFVRNTDGNFLIILDDNCDKPGVLTYENRPVLSLCWTSPNFPRCLEKAEYVELDATFKSIRPYITICPQGFWRDVGLPFGLMIAPSETAKAYQLLYEVLASELRREQAEKFLHMPVLSDSGSALASFAKQHEFAHYLCREHLKRSFGTRNEFYNEFCLLLDSESQQQAEEIVKQFEKDMESATLSSRRAQLNKVLEKYRSALNVRDKWATDVKRRNNHSFVAETTNGEEGLHHHFNRVTANLRTTLTRFVRVQKLVSGKLHNLTHSAQVNAEDKIRSLYRKAMKAIQHGVSPVMYQSDKCHCHKRDLYEAIYGEGFPCMCNIMTYMKRLQGRQMQRWGKEHRAELSEICEPLLQDRVRVMTVDELEENGFVRLDDPWQDSVTKDKPDKLIPCEELAEFGWEETLKTRFRVLLHTAESHINDKYEATWSTIQFCWTHNLLMNRMSHKEWCHYNHVFASRLTGDTVAHAPDQYMVDIPEPSCTPVIERAIIPPVDA